MWPILVIWIRDSNNGGGLSIRKIALAPNQSGIPEISLVFPSLIIHLSKLFSVLIVLRSRVETASLAAAVKFTYAQFKEMSERYACEMKSEGALTK